ncbi:MAG: CpsD/CapB family tyrosine-protein kinase [Gammaproteobacteria bacterium]|nr:CpsD/CapB family tyrosine-protein kinase [Gammaproteobacteria bacterium]
MDRIARALERAKENRQFKPAQMPVSSPQATSDAFAAALQVDIPEDFLRKMKIIGGFPNDPHADSYRLLRTRVTQRMQQQGWVTLGITSPRPRAGKTLTSINLAITIAMDPKYSVLLIDADLKNPSVHRVFGISAEKGIADYLTTDTELEGLLLSPGIERFAILPCVSRIDGSSELLGGLKMQALISSFKQRKGSLIVLFDLPPVLISDDVVTLSSKLDAMLIVVEDGATKTQDLRRSVELMEHAQILGTVLNKAREKEADTYGYY